MRGGEAAAGEGMGCAVAWNGGGGEGGAMRLPWTATFGKPSTSIRNGVHHGITTLPDSNRFGAKKPLSIEKTQFTPSVLHGSGIICYGQ